MRLTVAMPIPRASAVRFTLGSAGVTLFRSKYCLAETVSFFISGVSGFPRHETIIYPFFCLNELKLWIEYQRLTPLSSINSFATNYKFFLINLIATRKSVLKDKF